MQFSWMKSYLDLDLGTLVSSRSSGHRGDHAGRKGEIQYSY